MDMPKKVYRCGDCGEIHDLHWDAERSCMPTPMEGWVCPVCDEFCDDEEEAEGCCASVSPEGELVTCPNCFRDHDKVAHQAEVQIAGHCSVCNPAFSVDQDFKIHDIVAEHAHEHAMKLAGWLQLNDGPFH
ncbi:hypothetical protein Pfra02_44720 [Pseudomonas fragi]|nr:hypothetical protein Pfra02_44720 [Pseudomonas fragi]